MAESAPLAEGPVKRGTWNSGDGVAVAVLVRF